MVNDEDRGGREQHTVVPGQPVQRCGEVRLVLVKGTATATADQRVNDHQLRLDVVHQLHELGIALERPVGLNERLTLNRVINLLKLLFELHQRLITIQQQHRTFLDWNGLTPDDERSTSRNVFRNSPSRHGFAIATSAINQHHRGVRQHIRNQIVAFLITVHQILSTHQTVGTLKLNLINNQFLKRKLISITGLERQVIEVVIHLSRVIQLQIFLGLLDDLLKRQNSLTERNRHLIDLIDQLFGGLIMSKAIAIWVVVISQVDQAAQTKTTA